MSEVSNVNQSCPNCGKPIKPTGFRPLRKASLHQLEVANIFRDEPFEFLCEICGAQLSKVSKKNIDENKAVVKKQIQRAINSIPIVSTHLPLNWDYQTLQIVTAQTTTGTGVFAEFTSDFTDLLGLQSKAYNQKIQNGENLCMAMLRSKAVELGGNAVIAVDIDYAEVGASKGMLLVCMTGTAVKVSNFKELGLNYDGADELLKQSKDQLQKLNKLCIEAW